MNCKELFFVLDLFFLDLFSKKIDIHLYTLLVCLLSTTFLNPYFKKDNKKRKKKKKFQRKNKILKQSKFI